MLPLLTWLQKLSTSEWNQKGFFRATVKSLCFDGGSPQRSGPVLSALFIYFFFFHEIQYIKYWNGLRCHAEGCAGISDCALKDLCSHFFLFFFP